jgi:hypothetical protein
MRGAFSRLFRSLLFVPPIRHVVEKGMPFDPEVAERQPPAYFEGYWQSEKYFIEARSTLLEELEVKSPLTGGNLAIANEMERCESVSIHVRRGDYAADPRTLAVHGLCGPDYYKRADAHLQAARGSLVGFVFSDDISWCRQNLKLSMPLRFVDHNDAGRNFEDLRLMSRCKHHVIANSSFSWWGAWLNPREHKVVIAPSKWFATPDRDAKDIVPPGWIRV